MVYGVKRFAQSTATAATASLLSTLFLQSSVIFSNAVQQEWVFITPDKFEDMAQLIEHRTGIAEVMGSNPVKALIIFRLLLSRKLTAMTTIHFQSGTSFLKSTASNSLH